MSSGSGVARVECVRVAETGFGSPTNQTPSRPPSSTVLDAYSTVSTAAHPRLLHLVMTAKPTRAFSPNLSTALRPAHTRNAGSFPVSTPEADYTRTHDSEQRRAAAIAQHTKYENTYRKIFNEAVSVNGERFNTWRVSHLVSSVDFLLRHPCQTCYSP